MAAKLAFREHKMKVRSNLAITHVGPETLEEAVQDYINRNTDLYDLPGVVSVCVNISVHHNRLKQQLYYLLIVVQVELQ